MRWDPDQLAALSAVVDNGTFDAAAAVLHITPSAVSQRIRALESGLGQVVVTRARPCRPTPAGEQLIVMARQLELIEAETAGRLGLDQARALISVSVNADSLNTWFHDVLADVAARSDLAITVHVEDQGHSAELLRSGRALAAVTSEPRPVQGCSAQALGIVRYLPVAAPELVERHRTPHGIDWSAMPMLQFNDRDELQHDLLRRVAPQADPPVHRIPSSADFATATRLGLGWSMLPESQVADGSGRLVRLGGRRFVDVPLYWQRWRISSTAFDDLTESVRKAARRNLRPVRG